VIESHFREPVVQAFAARWLESISDSIRSPPVCATLMGCNPDSLYGNKLFLMIVGYFNKLFLIEMSTNYRIYLIA